MLGNTNEKYLTPDLKLVFVEHPNGEDYGYLVYKGREAQDFPFRLGGMFGKGFEKGDYASVIMYPIEVPSGLHCIINKQGEIVYEASKWKSPYYLRGVIARTEQGYYHLEEQKLLCPETSYSIESDEFLFVQHRFSFKNKEFATGVYRIKWSTGEVKIYPIEK